MSATLEIHTIGLNIKGDSSLFLVRGANGDIETAILCDCPKDGNQQVELYAREILGDEKRLDYVICSHYDADHVGGLGAILCSTLVDENTVLIDRGVAISKNNKTTGSGPTLGKRKLGSDGFSITYKQAWSYCKDFPYIIDNAPTYGRLDEDAVSLPGRMTAAVCADGQDASGIGNFRATNPPFQQASFVSKDWLIGQAPMVLGNGDAGVTITFVAANQDIRPASTARAVEGKVSIHVPLRLEEGMSEEEIAASIENQSSVAFLLQFGNFNYFSAGDLEKNGEEELVLTGYLSGKTVHAMKLSHHGSDSASPQEFLDRTNPRVAFVSNSVHNSFGHPDKTVMQRVTGLNSLFGVYMTGWTYGSPKEWAKIGDLAAEFEHKAHVAGSMASETAGSIVLEITAVEAEKASPGFEIRYTDAISGAATTATFV